MRLVLPYPVSTNRYWRKTSCGVHVSLAGRKFKSTVAQEYAYRVKPTSESVVLNITLHAKLTKKDAENQVVVDLDNCLKCTLDSLIGIVYHDDKQVKKLVVEYGEPVKNGAMIVDVALFEGVNRGTQNT